MLNSALLHQITAVLLVCLQVSACTVCVTSPSQAWQADNGDGTYKNPLFYADYPDPDIIGVGSDYYMTSTTMFSVPGLPILHSKDLVNWEILGYACPRLQGSHAYDMIDGTRYGRGLWAASLRYHNGTFYIFENTLDEGSLLFTATNPAGPWTRSKVDAFLFDPGLIFDDDAAYVFNGTGGKIFLAKLSPDLSKTVRNKLAITIPNAAAEGSHAYKINGMYYVFNAVGGPDSRMMCSRSRNIEGPYETITLVDERKGFLGSHQGGMVQLPNGQWWGVIMADHGAVGRVTNLSPITWRDGWPYFEAPNAPGKVPATYRKPDVGHVATYPHLPTSDDFHKPALGYQWQWNHNPDDSLWSLTERSHYLRLHAVQAPNLANARNTLTQRTEGPFCTATVELETDGMKPGDNAGFGLFDSHYTSIIAVRENAGLHLIRQINENGSMTDPSEDTVATSDTIAPGKLWIRITCDFTNEEAQLGYSLDGSRFKPLGDSIALHYNLTTFEGERFAIFNFNRSGTGGYLDVKRFTLNTSDTANPGLNETVAAPSHIAGTTLETDVKTVKTACRWQEAESWDTYETTL